MKDLQLDNGHDLRIGPKTADISITDSVAQAIKIRLLWFWKEWRFAPDFGVPYFEEVLIKNPNKLRVRQVLREAILSVEEVERVEDLTVEVDTSTRVLTVKYTANCRENSVLGEVNLHV
jgi:hypothetical protein